MSEIYCKDCKFCDVSTSFLKKILTSKNALYSIARCTHPKSVSKTYKGSYLVTGEAPQISYQYCSDMRRDPSACGTSGSLFLKKDDKVAEVEYILDRKL